MASQMVVTPSADTLFMRGFSTKQDIQKIRQFFDQEAGGNGCTVEFFKESEQYGKLFVALRFDSKDVAKDILNKYDNTDVMGDRVTISWFKDLRKARQKAADGYRRDGRALSPPRNGYHPGQYNRGFGYRRGWNQRGYYHRGMNRPYYGHHQDDYRSASRSRSRSRSRSYSRSRSRSRTKDRRSSYKSHSRSRSRSRTPESRASSRSRPRSKTPEKKKKKKSRKFSKEKRDEDYENRSPSPSPVRRSENFEDVPDALWEEEHNRSKDAGSPRDRSPSGSKSNKHMRSSKKSVDKDKDRYSDDEERDKSYSETNVTSKRKPRSPSPMSEDRNGEFEEDAEYDRKKGTKESKRPRGENYEDDQQYNQGESRSEKKRRKYVEQDLSPGRSSKSGSVDKGRGGMRRERSPFDGLEQGTVNGVSDTLDRGGALGLSQDKMGLVREKKEEIEKAYRQDCETFSAVVKMLISKNPELEEHLQDSLRDNLKDIGQRCIQELREFIESLKVQETTH